MSHLTSPPSSTMMFSSRLILLGALLVTVHSCAAREVKVYRGDLEFTLHDETERLNPKDYSEAFEADLHKKADLEDAYDELVPPLPMFPVVKNGRKNGYTAVPIVTRAHSTWLTPPPPTKKYKTWGKYTLRPFPTVGPLMARTGGQWGENENTTTISSLQPPITTTVPAQVSSSATTAPNNPEGNLHSRYDVWKR